MSHKSQLQQTTNLIEC